MKRADRIPTQDGDEHDSLGWCKKYFTFRPGERKKLKRKYNKRRRKVQTVSLREALMANGKCSDCDSFYDSYGRCLCAIREKYEKMSEEEKKP